MNKETRYIVVVQCDRVTRAVCSGFKCESAFQARTGGFSRHASDIDHRYLPLSCGGCPGGTVGAKLRTLRKEISRLDGAGFLNAVVHLATCMTHGTGDDASCPFLSSIRDGIDRAGFVHFDHTHLSPRRGGRRIMEKKHE